MKNKLKKILQIIKKNQIKSIVFLVYRRLIIRSYFNLKLGQIFFGNKGGIISNIIGRYILKKDSTGSKANGFVRISNPQSIILKNEGLLFDDNLVGSEIVQNISEEWGKYCDTQDMPDDFRLQLSSEDSLKVIEKKFPMISKLLKENLLEIVQQYYQSYVNLLNVHLYRISTPSMEMLKNAYGQTAKYHTDGSTSESIKIFILLSDVTEADGPMSLLNIEQTKQVLKNTKINSEECLNQFIESNYEPIKYTGNKGKVLIARTNDCLHRATIPENGRNRDILTLYLTSSSSQKSVSEMFQNATHEQYYGFKRLLLR